MTQNFLLLAPCSSFLNPCRKCTWIDSFTRSLFQHNAIHEKILQSPQCLVLRISCYFFSSSRGHYNLFETWFLLVQCAHWVEVAVRLLATSSPENCRPLLWLLTFFYHPTSRGHHRASLMVSSASERVFHSLKVAINAPGTGMAATGSKLSF